MKAGRLALRGHLGGDLSEFAQKPWESCDVNKIGPSGARHADVASFAVPERYRA